MLTQHTKLWVRCPGRPAALMNRTAQNCDVYNAGVFRREGNLEIARLLLNVCVLRRQAGNIYRLP